MLSIIVIAKNEEERIETCLASLKWADEVVVIDNGSEDKTVEIAKKYTDKVYSFSGEDFAALRNFAIEKTNGDWVLYVDADERVLEPLRKEVIDLACHLGGGRTKDECAAYAISRRNIIFGQEVKYGPFWPDWVIRLLKKEQFEGWVGKVHEYPKFKGNLGYTKNSLLHLTHRDVDQIVLKSLEWSKIDAKLRLDAGHPKMTGWRFIRILFSELFNQGIKRKGFFSGTVGVMDCLMQTFSMIITYIRLWQLQQPKTRDEVYKELDRKLIGDNFKY